MELHLTKTLKDIPAFNIAAELLNEYNALYPKEDVLNDYALLKEVYPNIMGILDCLPNTRKDTGSCNIICLLCQYYRGDGISAITELFKSIGVVADVTSNNGNISITIGNISVTDVSSFIKNLRSFIQEYSYDCDGEVNVSIGKVTIPMTNNPDTNTISVQVDTGITHNNLGNSVTILRA